MTLPVSIASNKYFFSTLKLIKMYFQLTIGNKGSSNMLVIAIECGISAKICLNETVNKFVEMRNRKYVLIY